MNDVVTRYMPDGTVRQIWTDSVGSTRRQQGAVPRRASRIESIAAGPCAGQFHVDFTLLYELTGDWRLCVCLPRPYDEYGEANKAEVEWLLQHYVRQGVEDGLELEPQC